MRGSQQKAFDELKRRTKSGSEMHPGGTMAEMPPTWKQKGQPLNMETPTGTDHGCSIKKLRSKK